MMRSPFPLAMLRRLGADRRATSSLEFVIVAMPMLILSFGTFEFARAAWTSEALQATATQAARCMGVLATDCSSGGAYSSSNTTSYVTSAAAGWAITVPGSGISLSRTASCAGVSGFSQVTITYTFTSPLAALLAGMTNGIPLQASSCFPNQA
ncbi:MAG: pilus assembly protein [Rhodospirillales bacterium]|nr:pilus assembly protein [Rhodospirillales bacterium]